MNRREEYLRADNRWTTDRTAAVRCTPDQIREALKLTSTTIHPQYFVGTAQHESNFALNERDTEPDGFQSWGVFQVSASEALKVGIQRPIETLKLEPSIRVMVYLAERIRFAIRHFLKLAPDAPDPPGIEPYIAIGHNEGIGQPEGAPKPAGLLATLSRHGLDWPGYVTRNPTLNIVAHGYGNDVLPLDSSLRKKVR